MNEAEHCFTKTFLMGISRFSTIISFRRVAQLGLPAVTPQLYQECIGFAYDIFHDPQYDHLFIDIKAALKATGGFEAVGTKMAKDQIAKFRAAVDAASLVFAHSILDSAALDYCKVTALVGPSVWEQFLENKTGAIKSVGFYVQRLR